MKKLFIIRHAKSDWADASIRDFARPLNQRGFKNAPCMAKKLKDMDIKPDLIISSPALRAITTAKLIAKGIDYQGSICTDENIYEANTKDLLSILNSIDDKNNTVFLVGHNPSISSLVYNLSALDDSISTCAVVQIEFDSSKWKDISKSNSKLISYDYPKKHK